MYIPFAFNGSSATGDVPTLNLLSWITPRSYPGSGSIWNDISGNGINASISGSVTSAGLNGWTFTSGTFLDYGSGSYGTTSDGYTLIAYGSFIDNNQVQSMWSKGTTYPQIWWIPFQYSQSFDAGPYTLKSEGFMTQVNASTLFSSDTIPDTPFEGFTPIAKNDYSGSLSTKTMVTFTQKPFNGTPTDLRNNRLYINANFQNFDGSGFGTSLNNTNRLYFGRDGNNTWPLINQPTISDLIIYTRALTAIEVNDIYTYLANNR